ncbi:methyltransferase regulatory domain-containing protein [Lelliottia sp. V89_10]|uniref:O-linked N-acetylglucosamine transferase family protein n=1 Tax=Lelliottia wanjuensis TaxID=3050585 RepID=UPI00249E6944|nr:MULTISPECIES: methyltransferase regulatory domain-containing protein [unclassified Lelliottia]MDI3363018.1 methyltransferase regulatory domain-containing protein [Lelliottia sp. V89_13]MDK9550287.1 methyltransferase regulatory domain-containing protein [Lelliottia sp. V89_5]MDK9595490.1 methyltransferase regulatory domain-containing protein [Lelliottia sp. V89_10]
MTRVYSATGQTPVALHAAASLYHASSVTPDQARILELGCGDGEGLVANALAWPESVAIGVDVHEEEIALGQAKIAQFSLTNLELHHAGLADLLASDLGKFDYIVLRGLFSLMGGDERIALLSWCQSHLSSQGVIALHWPVLPGAQEGKTLQDALCFHAGSAADINAQIDSARGMLSYLAMTLPEGSLKDQVTRAEKSNDLTLALRYLSHSHQGDYFVDFQQVIADAGLSYLGDAVPQSETASFYGTKVAQMHGLISRGSTRANSQQYLDFATRRSERFSLLIHPTTVSFAEEPDLESIEHLHWAGCFKRQTNGSGVMANGHIGQDGTPLRTDNKTTLQILDVLSEVWPLSLSFEQLLFHCRFPEETTRDHRAELVSSLQDLLSNAISGLMISAVPCAYNLATDDVLRPIVPVTEAAFADKGDITLQNYWGQPVTLSHEEWSFATDAQQWRGAANWPRFCALRDKGLLTGSIAAWRNALQEFMKSDDLAVIKQVYIGLLMFSCERKYGGFSLTPDLQQTPVGSDEQYDSLYDEVNALIQQGRHKQARDRVADLLKDDPDNVHLLRCQARSSLLMEQWQPSLLISSRLLGHYSMHWDSYYDLATALFKIDELLEARKLLRALLRIDDQNANCWNLLACLFHSRREMAVAEKCARQAIRLAADVPYFLSIMGIILSDNQKIPDARYFLEKSLSLKGDDLNTFTSLLFVLSHDVSLSPADLFSVHQKYGRQVNEMCQSQQVTIHHAGSKDPQRKLRVGFVSGDLRNHPVSNFFLPFWDNLNREHFDLIGYSTIDKTDEVSEHYARTSAIWRMATEYSDAELAKQIAEDQIDILVDLSGHTTGTRLPVFGFKPAPVQMTWIGYPGTSGLDQMDYRITTPGLGKPGEMDDQYTEKLLYMPLRSFFAPSELSPEVNPLPALSNGYFTYGSFNRPKKLNNEVFALWAQIMSRNPTAKLLIGFMDDDEMIARYRKKLCALGVLESQLIFRKTTDLETYLRMHHEVDLMLDSFPYTGGTTTSHGVWMGVPTLSIAGATTASRQGVEIMHIYGLQPFVATSQQDYVERAVGWQNRLQELNDWRQSMRKNMPLKQDGFDVAAPLEKALRKAWEIYCSGQPAQSFTVEE